MSLAEVTTYVDSAVFPFTYKIRVRVLFAGLVEGNIIKTLGRHQRADIDDILNDAIEIVRQESQMDQEGSDQKVIDVISAEIVSIQVRKPKP